MVLNIRQKQSDAILRMLHLNVPPTALHREEEDVYKVLVLDAVTQDIIAPLLRVAELRRHGITLHLMLHTPREPIPDVPAIYFVCATEENVQRIVEDTQRALYDSFHLNFATHLPHQLLEQLAAGTVREMSVQRVKKVFDQYCAFISLESGLFSLGMPQTYLQLNDPAAQDTQIEDVVAKVVDGLFSAIATLGVVPVIRCPKGGAAQHVAQVLDARIREHLGLRGNLFAEAGPGLAASLSRPLLCLFDRNFELSVVLQHAWTYKPLVHDVLGMALNRVTIVEDAPGPSTSAPGRPPRPAGKGKSYDVGEGDFFWDANGRSPFPKVAEGVEGELTKYKQAMDELSRQTGANIDPFADLNEVMAANTRGLMNAVSSLPELRERKLTIDKHTNLATLLLGQIKGRALDQFYNLEEDMLTGKADLAAVEKLLAGEKGTATDKLRLVLVYLVTAESLPPESALERLESILRNAGSDLDAFAYVRRMRRMNLMGKAGGPASGHASTSSLETLGAQSQLLSWADKTFGQGLTQLTKGVKSLLAGEQQAAVTVAMDAIMEARPAPDVDAFATYDPRAPAGKPGRTGGPFKEAIVFMIGGGNYLEFESLATWASRATPPKSIVYGATELLPGDAFVQQLAELGRRSRQ